MGRSVMGCYIGPQSTRPILTSLHHSLKPWGWTQIWQGIRIGLLIVQQKKLIWNLYILLSLPLKTENYIIFIIIKCQFHYTIGKLYF